MENLARLYQSMATYSLPSKMYNNICLRVIENYQDERPLPHHKITAQNLIPLWNLMQPMCNISKNSLVSSAGLQNLDVLIFFMNSLSYCLINATLAKTIWNNHIIYLASYSTIQNLPYIWIQNPLPSIHPCLISI